MLILYRCGIFLYDLAIKLASPVRLKARQFRAGRNELFTTLADDLKQKKGKLVWIHAASLGEFEQGRPVIESLKHWDPGIEILLTFFSPSGFEVKKNYPLADYIHYLPLDYRSNAAKFIAITKPDLAIFIKYELWYYYLMILQRYKIPTIIISAVYRPNQFYFKPYGKFFKSALKGVRHFYVQNERSASMLKSIGIDQLTIAGDTRFDRVVSLAKQSVHTPLLEKFQDREKVMVLGSVWSSDMQVLKPFINTNHKKLKFIIAPHNIRRKEIDVLLKLPHSVACSEANEETVAAYRILILDNVGMLSAAYRYGDFAYVGGGIRGALHNTLEAAVYGIPVFFGRHKNNSRFPEAGELVKVGAGFEVKTFDELDTTFERLRSDKASYQKACKSAEAYVRGHAGATSIIMTDIKKLIEP